MTESANVPKRILVHAIAGGYGGAERTIELLVPHLGSKCDFVFVAENDILLAKLAELKSRYPLKIVRVPGGRSPLAMLKVVIRTLFLCRNGAFDAVVTNTNKSALVMALCRPFLSGSRLGLLVFIRDFQWAHARLVFGMLGNWPLYVAPSKAITDFWPASYGPRKMLSGSGNLRLEILPDVMDELVVEPTPPLPGAGLLVLGTVNRWKGIEIAIEALALLGDRHGGLRLRVVGREATPGLLEELSAQARRLGVEGRVIFQPHVDDVESEIAASLCVVSASVPWNGGPETFGRTIIEAWASMRPVIASDCGGPSHLVDHGVDGLLFEPGSASALAAAIDRILSDSALAGSLASNGRKKFREYFTSAVVANDFVALIDRSVRKASC